MDQSPADWLAALCTASPDVSEIERPAAHILQVTLHDGSVLMFSTHLPAAPD